MGDARGAEQTEACVPLSPREQQVLELLAAGLNPDAVARRLDITTNTCRGHVKNLRRKLDATSTLHAVVTAIRLGLLDVGGPERDEG